MVNTENDSDTEHSSHIYKGISAKLQAIKFSNHNFIYKELQREINGFHAIQQFLPTWRIGILSAEAKCVISLWWKLKVCEVI